jgi:hypothetical protein
MPNVGEASAVGKIGGKRCHSAKKAMEPPTLMEHCRHGFNVLTFCNVLTFWPEALIWRVLNDAASGAATPSNHYRLSISLDQAQGIIYTKNIK